MKLLFEMCVFAFRSIAVYNKAIYYCRPNTCYYRCIPGYSLIGYTYILLPPSLPLPLLYHPTTAMTNYYIRYIICVSWYICIGTWSLEASRKYRTHKRVESAEMSLAFKVGTTYLRACFNLLIFSYIMFN